MALLTQFQISVWTQVCGWLIEPPHNMSSFSIRMYCNVQWKVVSSTEVHLLAYCCDCLVSVEFATVEYYQLLEEFWHSGVTNQSSDTQMMDSKFNLTLSATPGHISAVHATSTQFLLWYHATELQCGEKLMIGKGKCRAMEEDYQYHLVEELHGHNLKQSYR